MRYVLAESIHFYVKALQHQIIGLSTMTMCYQSRILLASKSQNDPLCFRCPTNTACTCSPGIKPTLPELLKFTCTGGRVVNIPVEIATKYVQFGTFLLDDRTGSRVKIIAHKHHYDAERINTEILQEWLTGRGKQPVTWQTFVEVLRDAELPMLAGDIVAVKCQLPTELG